MNSCVNRLLPDTVASTGAEPQDTPVQSAKRRFDARPEADPLPAKRTRLTPTDTQQPRVENEKPKQADKTALQQPEPKAPERLYASFLRNIADFSPPNRPKSAHSFVSEWLESVESDPENRCQPNSHLQYLGNESISRNFTISAPGMSETRDHDGFVMPQTPGPRSRRGTKSVTPSDFTSVTPITPSSYQFTDATPTSSSRSLVENPDYRSLNLANNNIYMQKCRDKFPEHITALINHICRDRASPGPSPDEVGNDAALEALGDGAVESTVEKYFGNKIFPDPQPPSCLQRTDRLPMAKHTVPNLGSKFKISTPTPDMLYGYNRDEAFPPQAQLTQTGSTVPANSENLVYPFFAIEFKGDDGRMWVATNQCLGGSASCVNIAERLNDQLKDCKNDKIQPIDSAAFSVAINGSEARLYISWKDSQLKYFMRKIRSFCLQDPAHYLEFRKYVRNIIDWGEDKRLNEIRNSLEILLEESRKRASEEAKSRQPPFDRPATRSKKPKSSSSRQSGSKLSSMTLSEQKEKLGDSLIIR